MWRQQQQKLKSEHKVLNNFAFFVVNFNSNVNQRTKLHQSRVDNGHTRTPLGELFGCVAQV